MKNMTESDFQSKFGKWLKKNWATSAAFELKIVKGNRFAFSQIKDHQIVALKVASSALLYWKIEDVGYCRKPFDCFTLARVPAYVVVMWERPRNKTFYMLNINDVVRIMKKKKSLTENEVQEIASEVGVLTI